MDSQGTSNLEEREDANWLVGTARRNITPKSSMWMAGYGAREGPSTGVHRDLTARAIALEDRDGNRAVVVSVETLFIGRQLRKQVTAACEEGHSISPKRILLNATHTHQGPVTRTATTAVTANDGTTRQVPTDTSCANFIPIEYYDAPDTFRDRTIAYRERLVETIVELIGDALSNQKPATLRYGRGRCGSAMSRRQPYEDGIAFRPYADGPVDHEVPVLAVTDLATDTVSAVMFGYACHTTVQFIDEFSGDWAGYAMEYVEAEFPDATAVFLQGCGGDQKAYPQRAQRYVEAHGRAVALGVEAALESVCRPVRGPLRVAYEEVTLSFADPPSREELEHRSTGDEEDLSWREQYLLSVLEEHGEIPTEYPYPIQTLGFGTDLTIAALAGEVLVEYSLRLKETTTGPLWVAAYSNNAFTYVPTERALAEGGYEADTVIHNTTLPGKWKPGLEDTIVNKTRSLVERVRTPTQ